MLKYVSMEEWNGIWKKKSVWNGNFLVWNGYGMEEILQYGIWKNRLPFHSIACPDQGCPTSRSRCTGRSLDAWLSIAGLFGMYTHQVGHQHFQFM